MKKRWVTLIALGSLVIGFGGATLFWQSFYSGFINTTFVTRTEADIIMKVGVLERIRAGKIADAILLLETQLDADLISAGALVRDGTRFNDSTGRAVALEARARIVSGYRPIYDNVHHAIQEAFRLVPESTVATGVQHVAPGNVPGSARP
jgi:hypothetical protein